MSTWMIFILYIIIIFLIYGTVTNIAEQIMLTKVCKNRTPEEIDKILVRFNYYKENNKRNNR